MIEKTELITEVIELQRQLNRVLGQYAPEAWMDMNLTIAQLKSLSFIARKGSTNSKQLAAALGSTSSNVTGIVDRLVEQGLVSRQENPEDRRMLLLRATAKGEGILANLRERKISHMSEILAHMSLEELSMLAQGLSSLVKAAEAYRKESKDEYARGRGTEQAIRPVHYGASLLTKPLEDKVAKGRG
jgi:DNA-binding MarR family transcriptional regulator